MPAPAPRSVLCVVGARPNFIKMAPILNAFAAHQPRISTTLVHTGQHFGELMNGQYFSALDMPRPNFNLAVGSGSHAQQTGEIMQRFEPVLDRVAPDAVLVAGDVNSTLACALVAQKKGVPVLHVEAGLRSFDRRMPEEINRLLTDQLSELLFTSEASGRANLLREGVDGRRIHFVGNVMIDSLMRNAALAVPVETLLHKTGRSAMFKRGAAYAVLTVHRPSNVDSAIDLRRTLELISAITRRVPVILPLHPRTRAAIATHGLEALLEHAGLLVTEPLGYLEMLGAMKTARVIITDSGGLQEEATVLGVSCITLRDRTERPITVDCGGNILVAGDREKTLRVLDEILRGMHKPNARPPLWDGAAAARIAAATHDWFNQTSGRPS